MTITKITQSEPIGTKPIDWKGVDTIPKDGTFFWLLIREVVCEECEISLVFYKDDALFEKGCEYALIDMDDENFQYCYWALEHEINLP